MRNVNCTRKKTIGVGILFLIFATVFGCATSGHEYSGTDVYEKPTPFHGQKATMGDHAAGSDGTDRSMSLPDMTSRDYETSGDRYFGQQDYAMAFVQYDRALEMAPENSRLLYKQGLLFLVTGQNHDAAAYFEKIVEKDSNSAAACEGLGTALFKMHDYEKAEPAFRKAVKFSPRMWRSRNYLGNIYDFRKDYDQAAQEYAEAILIRPNDAKLYNNLGVSLYLSGRYQESINAYKKAMSAEGDKTKVYNNLGLVLARTGRYDAAFDVFKEGSNASEAYNNLGCIYMAEGDYQKAEQMFNKAIENSPSFYHKAHENLKKLSVAKIVD